MAVITIIIAWIWAENTNEYLLHGKTFEALLKL